MRSTNKLPSPRQATGQKNTTNDVTTLLLRKSIISLNQMQQATKEAKEANISPVQHLINTGVVTEAQLTEVIAETKSLPFVGNILELNVPPEVIAKVPDRIAIDNKVIPIRFDEEAGTLDVVFNLDNYTKLNLRDDIRVRAAVRKVNIFIGVKSDIERSLPRLYRSEGKIQELAKDAAAIDLEEAAEKGDNDFEIDSESKIVQFVKLLLNQAITDKASDIHIEPEEDQLRIRFRIDGVLHVNSTAPLNIYDEIVARVKILSNMDTARKHSPQDGRLSVNHKVRGKIDMRVAALPTVHGEKIVMRILDNSQASLSLDKLGFSPHNLVRFRSGYTKPYGMILVTGPTGSGKSTTLYAALNEINSDSINIITVEDPVEYKIAGINQVPINAKQGMTFPNALRSILRSDPDVVLIGEIRDSETAKIAIEAGQTGHLVLSTLHTNNSSQALTRLSEMGIEPFLVGAVVEAILAQRLVRKLCKMCKEDYMPEREYLERLGFPEFPEGELPTLAKSVGCVECSHTGYSGRMGIHEVLLIDSEVEKMAVKEASPTDIEAYAKDKQKMLTLKDDGWIKVLEKQTSIEEILRVVAV